MPKPASKSKTTRTEAEAAPAAPKAAAPKAKTSPAERIKALEAEIARIRADEHDSRVLLIQTAIDELNAMGYQYRLVDENRGKGRTPAKAVSAGNGKAAADTAPAGTDLSAHYDEKKYCKLCQEHGHDARPHAKAGEYKDKAFSNEEKARRGLLPPELQDSFLAEQGHR